MSTTWLLIKQDVLNFFGQSQDPTLMRYAMPLTTSALGSTTTLKDDDLLRSGADANAFNGRVIEIVESVTSPATGPLDGEYSIVSAGGFATNTVTFSPALTNAVQTATPFLFYPPDLSPQNVLAFANRVLRNTEAPHLYAPSLVGDADFNSNDVTNWAAVGTPGTRAFVTTASKVLLGDRSLNIATTSTDHGAASASVPATEQETFLVSVNVKVDTGSCKVQLYDVTNSAEIEAVTVDEVHWQEVRFSAPVPTNCENVSVRFLSATATSDFHISGPVILQSQSPRLYTMPSWLLAESQFLEALEFPGGSNSAAVNQSYLAYSALAVAGPDVDFLNSVRGANPFLAQFAVRSMHPVYFVVQRAFDALTANTSTTNCDREYLMWGTMASLARARRIPDWREYKRTQLSLGRKLRYGVEQHTINENEKVYAGAPSW